MTDIALFVFHRDFDVCADNLRLLRALNPGLPIHGVFGGEAGDLPEARRRLAGSLESLYHLDHPDRRWKWQNGDLAVSRWYRRIGRGLRFDRLYLVQWDLVFCEPLREAYRRVPAGALGLSGLRPLAEVADRWWWTTDAAQASELRALVRFARERYGFRGPLDACIGTGCCLPGDFVRRYAGLDVPELCHDEIRLPLFARILGIPAVDTGFYPKWFDAEEERYFNADSREIEDEIIVTELARPDGRRVFHPYRKPIGGLTVAYWLPRHPDLPVG
ncbi:hypothetical protein [Propylenella binzhouense]|uniref:Uncharacterized protein n=1 Tax=Propylenella binzhouense TaxID=2555902 RepID=A0A964T5I8_9HYPH|nr:hypothetical protein [Propylenella binzhouense]MYZ48911.1 hypothetical protein [Propylenella binzhouense]